MNLDEINDLHERAMNVAEAAVIARTEGDLATSCERFQEALELATEAAAEIAPYVQEEPMRSVLHRSAASLALNCEEYRLAEKLLAVGLAGDPPAEFADEMRDLLEQVSMCTGSCSSRNCPITTCCSIVCCASTAPRPWSGAASRSPK